MASHTNHPDRLVAFEIGERHWRGPPCPEHGNSPRYVSSGNCVHCSRIRSLESARRKAAADKALQDRKAARAARVAERKAAEAEKRARPNIPDHPARLAALAAGERFWQGPPCRHGHDGLRYTNKTAACVECRRASNRKSNDGRN